MVAEIISPAVLYPLSLAKLLNSAPILHLTPEDLVDDAELNEALPVGDNEEGEDWVSEISIDAPGGVSGTTSKW